MRVPAPIHQDVPPLNRQSGHLVIASLVVLFIGFVPLANGVSAATAHMTRPSDERIDALLPAAELGFDINLTSEGYRAWDDEVRDRGIYVLQSVSSFLAWGFMLVGSVRVLNGHQRGLIEAALGTALWLIGGWVTELARSGVVVQGGPPDTSNLNVQIVVSMIKIALITWLVLLHHWERFPPQLSAHQPR